MHMIKKIALWGTAGLLAVSSLTGCSGNAGGGEDANDDHKEASAGGDIFAQVIHKFVALKVNAGQPAALGHIVVTGAGGQKEGHVIAPFMLYSFIVSRQRRIVKAGCIASTAEAYFSPTVHSRTIASRCRCSLHGRRENCFRQQKNSPFHCTIWIDETPQTWYTKRR